MGFTSYLGTFASGCAYIAMTLAVAMAVAYRLYDNMPFPPFIWLHGSPYNEKGFGFCDEPVFKKKFVGRKALVIGTSNDKLTDGTPTGCWPEELTEPYYYFKDSGLTVTVASPKGGRIPFEPGWESWLTRTKSDVRYMSDPKFQKEVANSVSTDDLDFTDFDIIYFAGGWGAAFDLGYNENIGKQVSKAYAAKKILGGACHGPLGLIKAKKPNGEPLLKGVKSTAVLDAQIEVLGIGNLTPQHPETELRKTGADFVVGPTGMLPPPFRTVTTVDAKHRIVTGQNQKSSCEVAIEALKLLEKST